VEITFLGQAGMFIETMHGSILCDPWFNAAYFASWFPFPSNEDVDRRRLARPTYLYVSHLHRDHFDPEFLRDHVSKDTTVLLPDFGVDALERSLREIGFDTFIHTKHGETMDLDGMRVAILAMATPMDGPIGDSALMVDDGETRLFNQNDSRPIDWDAVAAFGPYDVHFVQFSGAIWFPMVYDYTPEKKAEIGAKKRANQMARALEFVKQVGAANVVPSAGPPCFLDDALFAFNDFDRDPSNTFPDQPAFLDYMKSKGAENGHLMIPGTVMSLSGSKCRVRHPIPQNEVDAIFRHKRAYLQRYKARQQPTIDRIMGSLPRGEVDILASLRAWFEPLLAIGDYTCIGVNARVLLDCMEGNEATSRVLLDFQRREVRAYDGSDCDYEFRVDRGLVEACIANHEEDWVNTLFLSCRFEATRKGPFNEYVYNFFKCLTVERMRWAESCYAEKAPVEQLMEIEGHVVQRRCPHLKVDLTKFGVVENGVLTCRLHGWQFELSTGKCLTSEGHRLYSRPIEKPEESQVEVATCATSGKRKRALSVMEEETAPCAAAAATAEDVKKRAG
jgi:UDP-MurNAc hydroxylase